MSRRDIILKATSGAIQSKALDLTKYRQRSVTDRTRTMRSEEAAGAMAYSAMPWKEDPDDVETHPGNPLTAALLRLKYADQNNRELFTNSIEILLKRHARDGRRASNTMHAMALVALFEWIHDACPKCRGRPAGERNPRPCPSCKPATPKDKKNEGRRDTIELTRKDGTKFERSIATPAPMTGCPRCFGTGRIFAPPKDGKGLKCNTCWGTGRRTWSVKERWRYVSHYLRAGHARKTGMDFPIFAKRWHKKVQKFIDLLRSADKRLHESIDIQVSRLENADIVPGAESVGEPDELDRGAQEQE